MARAAEAKLIAGAEDELELDMMEAMGVDGDDDVPTFAEEEDLDADSEEGDEDESEENSDEGSGTDEEEVEESDPDSGFGDDDAEDWLRLGEVSEGEEEAVDVSAAVEEDPEGISLSAVNDIQKLI